MRFAPLILLMLGGCASIMPAAEPPLVTYTPAFEHGAANELRHCNSPHLCIMVTDYLKLRCAIKWADGCKTLEPNQR